MAGNQVDETKLELSSHPPFWITPLEDVVFERRDREIIEFFIVKTPCKSVSAREVLLTEYGWDNYLPKSDGYLYKRLMDVADLRISQNLFIGTKREHMKQVFLDASMDEEFFEKHDHNRIAYLANGNTTMGLFKAIRNSFAHSRFNIAPIGDKRFFIMENGVASGNRFEVKARMLLEADTLAKWIEIKSSLAVCT